MRYLAIAVPCLLAGCGLTTAQQTAVSGATLTLAQVAATKNTTVSTVLAKGSLVCGVLDSTTGQLMLDGLEVIANIAGVPVSVTGMASTAVADACPAGLVPGPLPAAANPAAVPVVPTPSVTLPPIT